MWFKFIVVGVKAGEKGKTAQVFLKCKGNESPFHVPDPQLAAFCLPLGPESQSLKERMSHEEYTFTLTQGDGTRVQGFCRRFLPPAPRVGSKLRFPQVLCLVCEASWPTVFFKVLDIMEQLLGQTDLLQDFSHPDLPADSPAGQFLSNLAEAVAEQPALGSVIRVKVPPMPDAISISPAKAVSNGFNREAVQLSSDLLELQVPPDCGNGTANAGISLARLLWHVPVPAMLTLIASLLLERRVLIVGQSRDMVSAAVSAAVALIYPFKWHHIFLPLLPRSFKDYLTAPMPFLIGMPAQLLPTLKGIPMDEVTLIDLDLGKCEPSTGSVRDDAVLLPWREQLEAALHAAFGMLRSPTEYESNPLITNIMQGYFLKLIGSYRTHVYPEGTGPNMPGWHSNQQAGSFPMRHSISAGSLNGSNSAREDLGRGHAGLPSPGREGPASGRQTPTGNVSHDDSMKGHGYWFDHTGLVGSHRRNERARCFLSMLRQSQMYEVFIQERLNMFATVNGGPEHSGDPFEQLVNYYLDNRSRKLAARLGAGVRSGLSRFTAFVKKHRRTGSNVAEGSSSFASSFAGGSLVNSPEAQRVKQLAATFASVAVGVGQIRRNLTEGSNLAALSSSAAADHTAAAPAHRHTCSSIDGLADQANAGIDPSAFFEDDEDELDAEAADAAAAAAAMASSPARQGFSRNNSSSSLKDLLGSAASWTAGSGNSSARNMRVSASGALEQLSIQQQQQQQQQQSRADPAPALQRRSVPAAVLPPGASAVAVVAEAKSNRSPSPLLDVRGGQYSSNDSSRPGSAPLVHTQQQPGHFLQQQHHMQRQQRPTRNSLSSIGEQTVGSSPGSDDIHTAGQQHQKPARSPAASGAASSHRALQHLHMKAALASITPGPLPQPPQPKARTGGVLHSSSNLLHSSGGSHLGISTSSNAQPPPYQQQQQQVPQRQVTAASAASAAVWDPFLELAIERSASAAPATANAGQQGTCSGSCQQQQIDLLGDAAGLSSTGTSAADSSKKAFDHSSIGQEQFVFEQQQQQVGDLLDFGPQVLSAKVADGFASPGQPIVSDHHLANSTDVVDNTAEAMMPSRIGQLLQLDDLLESVDVLPNSSSGDGSASSAAAPATPQIAAVSGTSGAGCRHTTAGSSATSSATGDVGLVQLEELLVGQTVSVAQSDSLLDM